MNKKEELFELYLKLEDLGFNKTEISNLLNCSRNTLLKIIKKEKIDLKFFKTTRIELFLEKLQHNKLDRKFCKMVESLENNKKYYYDVKYEKFNRAFTYAVRYIEKNATKITSVNDEDIVNNISMHLKNYHLHFNPYYFVLRQFFNKETRPLIDFNIDFDNNTIIDFQIKAFNSAKYNKKVIKNNYKLTYKEDFQKIINSNIEQLSQRQKEFIKKNKINFELCKKQANQNKIKFKEFIYLLNIICMNYSKNDYIRFNVYEDSFLNKFNYISKNVDKKVNKLLNNIKSYNFARFFNIDKHYYTLEKILINYNFHTLAGLSKDKYTDKIISDVNYRINELEKLIVMVSGLNYKNEDDYNYFDVFNDEEDYPNAKELDRIEKIKEILKN